MNVFSVVQRLKTKEFDKILENKLEQTKDNDDEDIAQILAKNYFYILSSNLPAVTIGNVTIDSENPYLITNDGIRYELDSLVMHNDLNSTEALMEIESLWNKTFKERVQKILSKM